MCKGRDPFLLFLMELLSVPSGVLYVFDVVPRSPLVAI